MDTILGEIFGNKEIGKNYLGLTFFLNISSFKTLSHKMILLYI